MACFNLSNQNVVIVAQNINTMVFNQYWFIQNSIFSPEEILQDSVFVPGFTNLSTTDCNIVIMPNQIQFTAKTSDISNCIRKRLVPIMRLSANSLQIKAIGFNFIWRIELNEGSVQQYSRSLFFKQGNPIFNEFDTNDACFGTYMSKYFAQTRLHLEIKPFKEENDTQNKLFILASFNFHRDIVQEDNKEIIFDFLNNCDTYYIEANNIICQLK